MPEQSHRQVAGREAAGLTLTELLIGVIILAMAIAALLGAVFKQRVMVEHARNLSWAMNDASRVGEQLREQNSGVGCASPSDKPPGIFSSSTWDLWLEAPVVAGGGGGKSIQPNSSTEELVIVRSSGGPDPLAITVSVCWRHRGRTIGGCGWNGTNLIDPGGVVLSPAMLTTSMTCRF